MGYTFETTAADIDIEPGNIETARRIIEGLPDNVLDYAGVDRDALADSASLAEALGLFDIVAEPSWNGPGYHVVEVQCGKWRDWYREVFEALTPAITPGSHIDFLGEDGEQWRYEFDIHGDIETNDIAMRVMEAQHTWAYVDR
ncbi:MAG: hypothetical protein ACYS1E_19390 [Planctomycetota bacterium]|jgi:hypothetical protein